MIGLVGYNIGYSFSPIIHNYLGYDYEIFDLDASEFDEFMLMRNFKAINVTIPYKEAVIPYLDELHSSAKELGVVNTVVNKDGYLIGYNTDTAGFDFALKYNQVEIKDKQVLILGTGATAESIKASLIKYAPSKIQMIGRTTPVNYTNLEPVSSSNIIINTSPIGVYPNTDQSLLDLSVFKHLETVIDVIYNPLNSLLISQAKALNIKAYGGLLMLVAQAVFAAEYFFDKNYDQNIIADTYHQVIKDKENIVLIGMPTSGKTSLGIILAETLNLKFYDVDQEIEKRAEMEIATIFAKYGETYFRQLEKEVILDLSKLHSVIIATGGGSVLDPANLDYLRMNGRLFLLDRSLANLKYSSDRPLNSSIEQLEKLYYERKDIYQKAADVIVDNNQSLAITLEKIIEVSNEDTNY